MSYSAALQALQDFNPLRYSVLPMMFLVTVVQTALKSLTNSSRAVLGLSLTFFMIISTPWSKILHGTADRGQLMVILYFFQFFPFYTHNELRSGVCVNDWLNLICLPHGHTANRWEPEFWLGCRGSNTYFTLFHITFMSCFLGGFFIDILSLLKRN